MDIFDSDWLLNMLAKSSKTPQGRMLSLFDILGDWLNAPEIQIKISPSAKSNIQLIAYLTTQAKILGASNPTILAEHIVLIARKAAEQEISHPGKSSLSHAKKAANALILAQTNSEWKIFNTIRSNRAAYGIAASFFLLIGIAFIWLPEMLNSHQQFSTMALKKVNNNPNFVLVKKINNDVKLTAQDAATMYAKYEQMRNGTCQFPEAIQIPDKDKAVYLENVVGGKLPTNLSDLATANFYLGKVRCTYTPMLMANSR